MDKNDFFEELGESVFRKKCKLKSIKKTVEVQLSIKRWKTMSYNIDECKKRKCPHCKKTIYLNYVRGCWDELKSKIQVTAKRRKW